METFRAREAAIGGTGVYRRALPSGGHPRSSRRRADRDGLTLGLKRHAIRGCYQVSPVEFIAGTTAGTNDPPS